MTADADTAGNRAYTCRLCGSTQINWYLLRGAMPS